MTAPDCPDPGGCPVPTPTAGLIRRIRVVELPVGTRHATTYRHPHQPGCFNGSGHGDTRFAPLRDDGGDVVPTRYSAASRVASLLETVFHDVHQTVTPRLVPSIDLVTRGLVTITFGAPVRVADLRDDALTRLGVGRANLVATTMEHYPCSRQWAHALRTRKPNAAGILWHSRVAELAAGDHQLLDDLLPGANAEVVVLFGDRVPVEPAAWDPGPPHSSTLEAGTGRVLVEQIAEALDATIVDP